MKKFMRITIKDRRGVSGQFNPHTYVVNRKFCENWQIPFDGQTQEQIKVALENRCRQWGIQVISIE